MDRQVSVKTASAWIDVDYVAGKVIGVTMNNQTLDMTDEGSIDVIREILEELSAKHREITMSNTLESKTDLVSVLHDARTYLLGTGLQLTVASKARELDKMMAYILDDKERLHTICRTYHHTNINKWLKYSIFPELQSRIMYWASATNGYQVTTVGEDYINSAFLPEYYRNKVGMGRQFRRVLPENMARYKILEELKRELTGGTYEYRPTYIRERNKQLK